eukprot:TRINITY_DN4492_c0_g1_i1.p1 TRINITY_DN4492_c0_g1~~TRINITY_DN4492_c0_g1_i1.p1  ORF type:complete len:141 (+),score=20.06 TRINITY_DN4492_c0_g1_i1:612-1034(+)
MSISKDAILNENMFRIVLDSNAIISIIDGAVVDVNISSTDSWIDAISIWRIGWRDDGYISDDEVVTCARDVVEGRVVEIDRIYEDILRMFELDQARSDGPLSIDDSSTCERNVGDPFSRNEGDVLIFIWLQWPRLHVGVC